MRNSKKMIGWSVLAAELGHSFHGFSTAPPPSFPPPVFPHLFVFFLSINQVAHHKINTSLFLFAFLFLIVTRIIGLFSSLILSVTPGHSLRSRWVAANPETLLRLVCQERGRRRKLSDEALTCCCVFCCLFVFFWPLVFCVSTLFSVVAVVVTTVQLPPGGFPGRSVPIYPTFMLKINPLWKFQIYISFTFFFFLLSFFFFFLQGSVETSWNIHLNHYIGAWCLYSFLVHQPCSAFFITIFLE